jgi:hypothetical protein
VATLRSTLAILFSFYIAEFAKVTERTQSIFSAHSTVLRYLCDTFIYIAEFAKVTQRTQRFFQRPLRFSATSALHLFISQSSQRLRRERKAFSQRTLWFSATSAIHLFISQSSQRLRRERKVFSQRPLRFSATYAIHLFISQSSQRLRRERRGFFSVLCGSPLSLRYIYLYRRGSKDCTENAKFFSATFAVLRFLCDTFIYIAEVAKITQRMQSFSQRPLRFSAFSAIHLFISQRKQRLHRECKVFLSVLCGSPLSLRYYFILPENPLASHL